MEKWHERRDLARKLTDLSRVLAKGTVALEKGAQGGSHTAFNKALVKLKESFEEASLLMAAAELSSFDTNPREFLDEFETLACSLFTDDNVVRIGSTVAIRNVVVRIPTEASGDLKATVGATEIRTSSVEVLLDAVRQALRADFDAKRFAKALVEAIQLHASLRGEDSRSSSSLEDLRKMISLGRDGGTSYTHLMFTHDLQSLATVGLASMKDAGLELSEAAGATVKYEVITEGGTLMQYGAIKHSSPEKRQA